MSFPRRRESSLYVLFWTPAFAGVTNEMCLLSSIQNKPVLSNRFKGI